MAIRTSFRGYGLAYKTGDGDEYDLEVQPFFFFAIEEWILHYKN